MEDFCFEDLLSKSDPASGEHRLLTDIAEMNSQLTEHAKDPEQEPIIASFNQKDLERAIRWQKRTDPVMMPMLDDWTIGGKRCSVRDLKCAFHGWQVLPDSRIAFFLGDSNGENIEAALTAASIRTAVKSLADQSLSPSLILERVNEMLWHDEMGDQSISLFCGMIDPVSGVLNYSSAGNPGLFVFNSYVDRNLLADGEPLGTDIDAKFEQQQHIILPGQSLIVYNDGLRQLCPSDFRSCEDEGFCQLLLQCDDSLESLNEWVEGRFASRSMSGRPAADAAFTLIQRPRDEDILLY
jgi:hypothetical protein